MMAPLMFGGLVVFMLIGYPVAFSLAAVGLFFGFIAIHAGYFEFVLMQALPERVFRIANDTPPRVGLFTLMGGSRRCGLAGSAGRIGPAVRAGARELGYAVIVVGAIPA
jgi:TRAP-type mannitol/chloroaromatic compound transport system permease large subunit